MTNKLKQAAIGLAGTNRLNDFVEYAGVAAAIETVSGNIYTGISIDTACSMGFCAEHSAVAEMLKHKEFRVRAFVAVDAAGNAVPPCGRCRELISQLAKDNLEAIVEVKNGVFKSLKELLPFDWKENLDRNW
ncbi:cytidine deaminase [Sphingobacterium puteale]|uniref:Cytidine deaminase n=3 Tax=Sphingobacteriaceae TaxID=84566 RepID=A0A363P0L6_9SPHI|nr:cytidine deaminase [Sphingobacterium athyrii]QIH37055.1 cytidine deaminase [Sphingobacterium sp. DR205]RKO72933.1 cytidine deaminase [Sphingobacterium puteale]